MKRAVAGRCWWTMALFALVGIGGCDKKAKEGEGTKEREPAREQKQRRAKEKPKPPPKEVYGERHEAARKLVDTVVSAAAAHFDEHDDWKRATFPGGTNVEFQSISIPPKEGRPYKFKVSNKDGEADGGDAKDTSGGEARLEKALELGSGTTLPAQIVYETGPGRGAEATAIVKAVIDFDPANDQNHTIFQELTVDAKTGSVNVFPRLVEHRWK